METNQNLLSSELQIDAAGYAHLKETAMWAKFLAIVGFVLSVLLVFAGLFAGTFMASLNREYGGQSAANMSAGILSVFYIIIAVVYFIMSLYLYRFAVRMRTALTSNDQESLNSSFLNLKLVYRILGIIMVIYLGIIVLALIAVIGVAALR